MSRDGDMRRRALPTRRFNRCGWSGLFRRTTAAFLLSAAVAAAGWLDRVEMVFFDAFSALRLAAAQNGGGRNLPVIVAIDSEALGQYGRWPWPRSLLARLLTRIAAAGPSVIGVDLLLTGDAPADASLAGAVRGGSVVLAERLDLIRNGCRIRAGRPERPAASLERAALGTGFIDFFPDPDGTTRRLLSSFTWRGEEHPSLAARMALAEGGPVRYPARGEALLSILRDPRDWETISAARILDGRVPALQGRAVLVGLTAPGTSADFYPVAVRSLGRVPGVFLHALAYMSLTAWGTVEVLSLAARILLAVLPAAILLPVARLGRPWLTLGATSALSAAVLFSAGVLFLGGRWWPPAWPLLGLAGAAIAHLTGQAAEGFRREQRLRASFARFVSPQALRQILEGPAPDLSGEAREITVLFADLRGFTSFAEQRPPGEAAASLNRHLSIMGRAILAHGGMLDKFMGDEVMGIFGAPLADSDHRRAALAAAFAIRDALNEPDLLPPGIGVASGWAVVGNIGSAERLDYTAVGDPVNLAARLEELAGPYEILAEEGCFAGAKPGPDWDDLGPVVLRGRARPAHVYRSVMAITASRPDT